MNALTELMSQIDCISESGKRGYILKLDGRLSSGEGHGWGVCDMESWVEYQPWLAVRINCVAVKEALLLRSEFEPELWASLSVHSSDRYEPKLVSGRDITMKPRTDIRGFVPNINKDHAFESQWSRCSTVGSFRISESRFLLEWGLLRNQRTDSVERHLDRMSTA